MLEKKINTAGFDVDLHNNDSLDIFVIIARNKLESHLLLVYYLQG